MENRRIEIFGEWKNINGTNYYIGSVKNDNSCYNDGLVLYEINKDGEVNEHLFVGENFRVEMDEYLWNNHRANLLCFGVYEDILNHLDQGKPYWSYIADGYNTPKEYDFDIIYKNMKKRGQR